MSATKPDYYESMNITLKPMDVMDYLPSPLANAFKYLVRAGNKPDNSAEQDLGKAIVYIHQYLLVLGRNGDDFFPEVNGAFAILKFYCSRSKNYLRELAKNSSNLKNFAKNVREYCENRICDIQVAEKVNSMTSTTFNNKEVIRQAKESH